MDDHSPWLRFAAFIMSAVGGTVTSLSAMPIDRMTRGQILLTLLSGFAFAIFVTPWIAQSFFGIPFDKTQAICGMTYIFGAGWNVLLPKLIQWVGGEVSSGDGK